MKFHGDDKIKASFIILMRTSQPFKGSFCVLHPNLGLQTLFPSIGPFNNRIIVVICWLDNVIKLFDSTQA